MGLGVSIFLIAVGAILTWAVNATVTGLELQTIGVILMVVGALGLVLSMIFWSSWGGFGGERRTHHVRRGRSRTNEETSRWGRERGSLQGFARLGIRFCGSRSCVS